MGLRIEPVSRVMTVLVDPSGATRSAATESSPWSIALTVFTIAVILSTLVLLRQLALLNQSLAPLGQVALDSHHAAMRSGLTRVIVADRILLSPTMLLAAVLVVIVSEPILSLADDRRKRLWTIVLLGLAPLLIQEVGELALTYLAAPTDPTPGEAVGLANRFVTGPLLFWRQDAPAPLWLQILNSRLNIITLWCVALWAIGLRSLDGGRLLPWHVAVPLTSLGIAGVVTWVGTPLVTAALLGRP